MCHHAHKSPYINSLSKSCTIPDYFNSLPKENLQFKTLPTDQQDKCIFHSTDLKWKRANQCGERFWELLHVMSNDKTLEDIDCREFILTGMIYKESQKSEGDTVPMAGESIIAIANLEINKPLRLQGAKFYDDLLIRDVRFKEALDFDEAVFKGVVTMERCHFEGMVSFIADCRFENNFWVEDCRFEESADFHNMVVLQQCYFTDVHFDAEVMFVGLAQIAPDLICSFTQVTFSAYTSFSNSGFNSSLAFDNCRFLGETHFENTAFRKRLQVIEPTIADKIFFQATKPGVKLFENAVDFEVSDESFDELGQIIFQNVNIYNFNTDFKSQIKTLEVNHKIELREGCVLYRNSIERIFPYSRFSRIMLEDLTRALANYFDTMHQQSLQIDVIRDLKNGKIKIVYHTEENLTVQELENLIFQTKKEVLGFLANPKVQLDAEKGKKLLLDHFLQLRNIWERYGIADLNGLLETPILEELMTSDNSKEFEVLKELFGVTVNVYIKNLVKDSFIESGGDVRIGDVSEE